MEYVTDNDYDSPGPAPGRRAGRAIITPLLLALFLVIYAAMSWQARIWNMSFKTAMTSPFGMGLLQKFGALIPGRVSENGEYFRLVTSGFVHLNLIHLIFNGYCVFSLGRAVEYYYGARRMFVLFVACTISANAFVVVMSPEARIHVGTLGGLFGLDGVLLGFALRNRSFLDSTSFKKMIYSALFWPVLWVGLSLAMPDFRGGVEGLLAGFGAGMVLGFAFKAVKFRAAKGISGAATALFIGAVAFCAVGCLNLLAASGPVSKPELKMHVCEEGGFQIPVPDDMEPDLLKGELRLGRGSWIFCRVAWREKGAYDEIESLVRQVIFDRNFEADNDGDVQDVHLVEKREYSPGAEEGAFFVLSMNVKGDEMLYAQAVLINDGQVYTITFYYPASDELRQEQVDEMINGFGFIESAGD